MSQVNNKTFPNTTFPDSLQSLPIFLDLQSADQSNYINYLKAVIAGNVSEANTYLSQINNNSIITANKLNILADTIGAIQEVYKSSGSFESVINKKQSEWQKIIDEFRYIGDWVEPEEYIWGKYYNAGDIIFFQNKCWRWKYSSDNPSSDNLELWYRKNMMTTYTNNAGQYILYIATTDINNSSSPDLGNGWKQITIVGDKGENGVGFMFKSDWDATITYSFGNFVIYDGNAYSSLRSNNKNHNPSTSPTYWQKEFETSMTHIPVQKAEPINQNAGDIWFYLDNNDPI